MKYSMVLALGLAAYVSAQTVEELRADLPACAVECIESSSGNAGCEVDDYACQCTEENYAKIAIDASPCIQSECTTGEAGTVIGTITSICDLVAAGGGGDPAPQQSDEPSDEPTDEPTADPTATETDDEPTADPTATETDDEPTESDAPATSTSEGAAVPTAAWNYAAVAGAAGVVAAGMM